MPPPDLQYDYAVRNPTDEEVSTLKRWVALGAPPDPQEDVSASAGRRLSAADRGHWAFVPPNRPEVPQVERTSLVSNAIDAFLLQKLEEKGLAIRKWRIHSRSCGAPTST